MPSAASLPYPADPADQQAEDALYYRAVLHELIDIGMGLARAVPQQATAGADPESQAGEPAAVPVQAAAAFDRISRAVRRTVALARKLAEPLPPRADAGRQRAAARRRIIREVEDAIQREAGGADAEALGTELHERLDAPELDDEIGDRPVAEVITEICRDLGLLTLLGNHPWKRRTPADIAALCTRAAQAPGAAPSLADPSQAPPPVAAQAATGRGEAWAGPPPYSREASIELMHQLLALRPPIRGP